VSAKRPLAAIAAAGLDGPARVYEQSVTSRPAGPAGPCPAPDRPPPRPGVNMEESTCG